jgi:hypothetical protein
LRALKKNGARASIRHAACTLPSLSIRGSSIRRLPRSSS